MRFIKILFFITIVTALCCPLNAQQTAATVSTTVPPLVNFSGRAMNSQGKPLTGVAGLTFAIYKDQFEGSPLWIETQNVQIDAKGDYTVQLGASRSEGLPLDLFASGEARWLGVRIDGGEELPRVLLLSVPYALKAADAQTLGGLPASAFLMAGPAGSTNMSTTNILGAARSGPNVSGTGTQNFIPLWTDNNGTLGNSILFQLGTGSSAKIGINQKNPLFTLDVNGQELVRGLFELATKNFANKNTGFNSQPLNLESSAFNSSTGTSTLNHFQWQAEPVGNNTSAPGATLNLLYGQDPAAPAETGLSLNSKGVFTFAGGQTFPGTGTVTSVGFTAPSSDFTVSGSPITKSGTLALGWKVAPTNNNTANAIVKRDANGAFSAGPIITTAKGNSTALTVNSSSGDAIIATSVNATGVVGFGFGGVFGQSFDDGGIGASGVASGTRGQGLWGEAFGSGGQFNGVGPDGVHGVTHTSNGFGVSGFNTDPIGTGIYGFGAEGGFFLGMPLTDNVAPGAIVAEGAANIGSFGEAGGFFLGGDGDTGFSGGDGIDAFSGSPGPSLAGFFGGDVDVSGNLSKSGGSFKIDHPLDPANKYLYHSFVESPDMMNIYNGNVTTDAQGNAVVRLPEWFEALNQDFRYQLTVMGQFAQAIVSEKVANHQFSIKTDKPNVEVSWQVTGIRHDAWADAHRIPVEQEKASRERGFYLHPELFGAPADKSIAWARNPQQMRRMKARHKITLAKTSATSRP